jgi:YD repeat-containing protein
MAKAIEEFAWIYNNVELELYPGLMKGPTATEQTKAGNNWDQAALLEKRLHDTGAFGANDVRIATGRVRVAAAQFDSLANWLGVKSASAALTVLQGLDAHAVALDANGDNAKTTQLPAVAIEFTHAWVRAYAPTANGMNWIDLDPSWKMKDRANGISLPADIDNVRSQLGVFDEIGYLALDPEVDRRLPVEYFEDQLMAWLVSSAVHRGSSLAEVAYDGPILTKAFQQLPAGLGDGVVIANPSVVAQYEDSAAIAATPGLTHRVTVRLKKGSTQHWSQTLAVPVHSLDSIQISFGASVASAQNNPNDFAPANSSNFYSRLVVGGAVLKWGTQAFTSADNVTIEVEHLGPQTLVSDIAHNRQLSFSRKPGQIMAVSLDANQHSHHSLAALQAQTLSAVAAGDSEADLRKAIDDLVVYAGAKYWNDFNRYNRAIEGVTGSVGVQQWVGSGIVTADPTLLLDPVPEGTNDYVIEYLPYGIAPANFGVDLPNINHAVHSIVDGSFHTEAWQLISYNSSALEHSVVEEIISAGAVSTMKGLQQAFQRDMGLDGNGQPITADVVQEYTRRKNVNGDWEIRHVGNWYSNGTSPVMASSPANVNITANVQSYLLSTSTGQLRHHTNHTNLGNTIHSLLTGDGEVRILVPLGRTELDNWVGGVYLVEKPSSMLFAIQADGGPPASGGYSGNVTAPPPPELQSGTFAYAGYAGDPVHTSNGNMFRDETDIVFPNIGVPLTFSRHYDSQSKDDVGMGVGWTYSFSDMLYLDKKDPLVTSDDEVVWVAASGARHRFKKLSDNAFAPPAELKGTLTRVTTDEFVGSTHKYVYVDPSGMEYHFQEQNDAHPNNGFEGPHTAIGRLRMQRDQNGDGVAIDYINLVNGHGFTRIRDLHDATRRLVFDYRNAEGINRISTIQKYDGGTDAVAAWTYVYTDVIGVTEMTKRLFSVSSPAVAVVNASGQEATIPTTVVYDYNNSPGDPAYAKGMIKKITEADGSWHAYEYYRNGRVFRVKQGEAGQTPSTAGIDVQTFNYNLFKNSTEFVDERGNVETYFHQKNGLQEKQIHADRSQTKSTWGAIGGWNEFVMTSTTDERGAVESFTYYNTSGVAGSEFKHKQLYEATAKRFPNQTGLVTRYDYVRPNAVGQPHLIAPSTIIVDPNGAGDPGTVYYVGQPLTTTSSYYATGDSLGRLWKTTDAAGNVVEYSYYPNDDSVVYRRGLLQSIKQPAIPGPNDPDGVATVAYETVFDYNAGGEITMTTRGGATTTTFQYSNANGIFRRTKDATNVVIDSIYDPLGRLRETGFGIQGTPTFDPIDQFTTRFKYDAMGRVRESIDPLGRVTRFEYDRLGNLVKQTGPDGTAIFHEYDGVGNRVATTDALKRTTRFVYDGRNRLIQTIRPDGAVERVRYDGLGNVVALVDALGAVTTYRYDAAGRLLETKQPDPTNPSGTANPTTTNKYDKLGNLIETIDPEANVTQFKYDKLGRVVQSQTLKGVNGNRNSANLATVSTLVSLTTTDYDAVGNVIKTAAYDVSQYNQQATATLLADPRAQQTAQNIAANKVQVVSARYDAFGRRVKTINADGTSTRTEYDDAGRVHKQYDEANSVTEFVYDLHGRLVATKLPDPTTGAITGSSPTTVYQLDAVGNRIAATDARGFTTRFEYDLSNRLIAATDPLGGRTRSMYDVAGQLVAAVDELGAASYTKFDDRGRPDLQLAADPDGVGPKMAPVTRSRYDLAGRLIETIDPRGYSTTFQYDRLGRLFSETSVAAVAPVVVLATRFYEYDSNGNLVKLTDELGRATDYQYDELDRRTVVQLPLPGTSGVNWANLPRPRTTTAYDGYGNVTSVLEHRNGGANQRTTAYEYDRRNRLTTEVLDAGTDGTNGVANYVNQRTVYQYDAVGNLESKQEFAENSGSFALLRTTSYQYDKLGRLTRETLNSDGNDAVTTSLEQVTKTTYDAAGNVQTRTENAEVASAAAALTTTYVYDAVNRIIRETTAGSSQTRVTRFQYDAAGNLLSVVDPSGRISRSEYDRLGRLVKSIAPRSRRPRAATSGSDQLRLRRRRQSPLPDQRRSRDHKLRLRPAGPAHRIDRRPRRQNDQALRQSRQPRRADRPGAEFDDVRLRRPRPAEKRGDRRRDADLGVQRPGAGGLHRRPQRPDDRVLS